MFVLKRIKRRNKVWWTRLFLCMVFSFHNSSFELYLITSGILTSQMSYMSRPKNKGGYAEFFVNLFLQHCEAIIVSYGTNLYLK